MDSDDDSNSTWDASLMGSQTPSSSDPSSGKKNINRGRWTKEEVWNSFDLFDRFDCCPLMRSKILSKENCSSCKQNCHSCQALEHSLVAQIHMHRN